jgi:hypothetical protein
MGSTSFVVRSRMNRSRINSTIKFSGPRPSNRERQNARYYSSLTDHYSVATVPFLTLSSRSDRFGPHGLPWSERCTRRTRSLYGRCRVKNAEHVRVVVQSRIISQWCVCQVRKLSKAGNTAMKSHTSEQPGRSLDLVLHYQNNPSIFLLPIFRLCLNVYLFLNKNIIYFIIT